MKMEGGEGDDDLIENSEIFNIPWDPGYLDNFPENVAMPRGQMLQNDDSLEHRNLIQNSDPSLLNPNRNRNRNQNQNPNPNQNQIQGQQQALSPPLGNMLLNPNHNNFNEPPRPPRYQLNAERVINSNHLPSYQNQYMRRPPSQPSTTVASSSGGVPNISSSSRKRADGLQPIQSQPYGTTMNHHSYSGIGSSVSEPMHHNMEDFVRNTRMRINSGQGRPSVVTDSSNTAQHNMGFPRPNPYPGQSMTNRVQYSNTLSNPLARPNINPGHPASNNSVASNTHPQARPNPGPGDPMASHVESTHNFSIPLARMIPNYFSAPLGRPNINSNYLMSNNALASNTPSISQARPNINFLGHPRANHAIPSNTLSIPQARSNPNPGNPMVNPALASNSLSFPLAGGRFDPRVGTYNPPMQIPVTSTTRASVPVAGVISQSISVNEAIPAALPSPHRQSSSIQAATRRHCMCPACTRANTSLGASQVRSQGVSMHQTVPVTPSVPASSDSPASNVIVPGHAASQVRSQDASVHQVVLATPSVPATSVLVPSHTASTSQIGNRSARVVQERPRYRLPRDPSQAVEVWVYVQEPNLSRRAQERQWIRALHPEANERQLDILLVVSSEMINEWRQIDRHLDMRLDTDHMSHEELMALEEMIGDVNTGISEETVNERMIRRTFSALLAKGAETCCICLEEFVRGDQVGTLDCGHNFHTECIKKWLAQKNTCPICKEPGLRSKENNG